MAISPMYLKHEWFLWLTKEDDKTGVINDPLGQTHSQASSDHYFHLKIVLFYYSLKSEIVISYRYVQTICVKLLITTGRDCGLASWINDSCEMERRW